MIDEPTPTPTTPAERSAAWLRGLAMALGLRGDGGVKRVSKHRNPQKRSGYGNARRVLKRIRRVGSGRP